MTDGTPNDRSKTGAAPALFIRRSSAGRSPCVHATVNSPPTLATAVLYIAVSPLRSASVRFTAVSSSITVRPSTAVSRRTGPQYLATHCVRLNCRVAAAPVLLACVVKCEALLHDAIRKSAGRHRGRAPSNDRHLRDDIHH